MSLKAMLTSHNLRPRKSLGQHFLLDGSHVARIIAAAELIPTDWVLEIGPGPGVLTEPLVKQAGVVAAVELDPAMITLLGERLAGYKNLVVLHGDILKRQPGELLAEAAARLPERPPVPTAYKVVANLPYYITSAVLRHLLESTFRPARLVVTIQKEVAQRITAGPGDMSLLALSVQYYSQPKIMDIIPAGAFYPPPKVDSAVLRLDTYSVPPVQVQDEALFFRIAKAGFGQKRKQLRNSLMGGLHLTAAQATAWLKAAGIDPVRRAETLNLEEWARLTREFAAHNNQD
jgi:16S rRNA (adenine1518-N6/adenine1519-N6)-dimethyltransferase